MSSPPFITVLRWWLEDQTSLTAREANRMFRRLALGGLGTEVSSSKGISASVDESGQHLDAVANSSR